MNSIVWCGRKFDPVLAFPFFTLLALFRSTITLIGLVLWLSIFFTIITTNNFFLFFSLLISFRFIVWEQKHCLLKQNVYNLLCGTWLGLMSFTPFINQIMRLYMCRMMTIICKYIYIHHFYLMNQSAFNSNALVVRCVLCCCSVILFFFPKFFLVSYLSVFFTLYHAFSLSLSVYIILLQFVSSKRDGDTIIRLRIEKEQQTKP